jgi:choline dehydrogenase-like flavoprotein
MAPCELSPSLTAADPAWWLPAGKRVTQIRVLNLLRRGVFGFGEGPVERGDGGGRARIDESASVGSGQIIDTDAEEAETWHALGGVPMGDAVDRSGRVLGHQGLYMLDGARIPGSTGACNPSMTIAALAEHSMATIVTEDAGRVF